MRGGARAIVYCLTRDRELAEAMDTGVDGALAFFYNDAARLHQAVMLRRPDVIVVDTGAIRPEYGDAGLASLIDFLRRRAPAARLAVRPGVGVELLVAAEAGPGVDIVPADQGACVEAVAALSALGA